MTSTPVRTAGVVFAWVLAGVLVLAVAVAAWIGIRGMLAYGHLRDAQAAAAGIRASLDDPATAASAVAGIAEQTSAARSLTSDPVWAATEGLPWIGPQLAAVSTVAAAIDDVVGTALEPLAEVAGSLQLDALRPVGGRIDLTAFTEIRDAATVGATEIADASAAVDGIDSTALLRPLRAAVDEVSALLAETSAGADALARAAALLPPMLGADGPRNYLVLFQNNAEWRSLGGIPGAMALLSTDGGALSLAAQQSSGDYPRYDTSVLPLGEEIEAVYGQRPGRWIQNVTLVPDFAVSAQLAREMWARENGGQWVDGVLALDPVSLSYLLEATGPVTLPTGDVLTSENAVPLLLNEVYFRYEDPADQDAFFAIAAAAVFGALANGAADPTTLVEALARAGDERRLLIWSARPDDQEILAGTTLAGGLPVSDADTARFGAFVNDGTGSKMDFYATADTAVAWDESCSTANLTMTLTSTAPADAAALPAYITGGGSFGVPAGITRTVGYAYLPEGWELVDASITGDLGFGGGEHAGRRVVSFTADLAPGQSVTATVTARPSEPGQTRLEVASTPTIQPPAEVVAVCGAP